MPRYLLFSFLLIFAFSQAEDGGLEVTTKIRGTWHEGNPENATAFSHIKVLLQNRNNETAVCGAALRMSPADLEVKRAWNIEQRGNDTALFYLPIWFRLGPGRKYRQVGLIVYGDQKPEFEVAEVRKC